MIIGWADVLRRNNHHRQLVHERLELNKDRLTQITRSHLALPIRYASATPELKRAFDYVHQLYPYAHVRSATVYQVPRSVSEEIGYVGAGGFFDILNKVVVITDCVAVGEPSPMEIRAELTPDEVLCHELIHYAANYKNPPSNRNLEEEIAYGKSVLYLRMKGHDDDFIIRRNMMPYLITCINKWQLMYEVVRDHGLSWTTITGLSPVEQEKSLQPYSGRIMQRWQDAAHALGQNIIKAYTKPKFDDNLTPAQEGDLLKAERRRRDFVLGDDI